MWNQKRWQCCAQTGATCRWWWAINIYRSNIVARQWGNPRTWTTFPFDIFRKIFTDLLELFGNVHTSNISMPIEMVSSVNEKKNESLALRIFFPSTLVLLPKTFAWHQRPTHTTTTFRLPIFHERFCLIAVIISTFLAYTESKNVLSFQESNDFSKLWSAMPIWNWNLANFACKQPKKILHFLSVPIWTL